MNESPITKMQEAPPPPLPLKTSPTPRAPRAPRGSKRKQPIAENHDASLQELIAEAARLHAKVYVDDVSGTIHGPRKASSDGGLAAATPARESWGFREAYADALASRGTAELPLHYAGNDVAPESVAIQSSHVPTSSDGAKVTARVHGKNAKVVRIFRSAAAAVQLFLQARLRAAGTRWSEVSRWYQEKRLAQLKSKRLRVVETVSLGEKRFISVVQVDGAEFLVGGSATGIALLRDLGSGQQILSAGAQQRAEQG